MQDSCAMPDPAATGVEVALRPGPGVEVLLEQPDEYT